MKKLTKKQRHEIYKKALGELEIVSYEFYLCHYFRHIVDDSSLCMLSDLKVYLPEIAMFGNSEEGLWYSANSPTEQNNDVRKVALMFCIEMTRP